MLNPRLQRMTIPGLVALAVTLVSVVPAASRAGEKASHAGSRSEVQAYQEPALGFAVPEYGFVTCDTGCIVFDVLKSERYVSVEAQDSVAPDVAIAVYPWDGDVATPRYQTYEYCTATDHPLRLPRWANHVWVEVLLGPCTDGTPATATRGTVTATFSHTSR